MLNTRNGKIIAGIIVLIIGMIAYKLWLDNKAKKATGKTVEELIKAAIPAAPAVVPPAPAA